VQRRQGRERGEGGRGVREEEEVSPVHRLRCSALTHGALSAMTEQNPPSVGDCSAVSRRQDRERGQTHAHTDTLTPTHTSNGMQTETGDAATTEGRMDGWMDGRTDGRTDGWMDGRTDV
jgi:hypothetical protein